MRSYHQNEKLTLHYGQRHERGYQRRWEAVRRCCKTSNYSTVRTAYVNMGCPQRRAGINDACMPHRLRRPHCSLSLGPSLPPAPAFWQARMESAISIVDVPSHALGDPLPEHRDRGRWSLLARTSGWNALAPDIGETSSARASTRSTTTS